MDDANGAKVDANDAKNKQTSNQLQVTGKSRSKTMQTNLEYYKIFYYVSKYNSISLAAEALSISQPAVSQAVKHLESDLSCALFVRTSKGVRLTKEGELLAEYVTRGYDTILTGEKKLSEMLNLDA